MKHPIKISTRRTPNVRLEIAEAAKDDDKVIAVWNDGPTWQTPVYTVAEFKSEAKVSAQQKKDVNPEKPNGTVWAGESANGATLHFRVRDGPANGPPQRFLLLFENNHQRNQMTMMHFKGEGEAREWYKDHIVIPWQQGKIGALEAETLKRQKISALKAATTKKPARQNTEEAPARKSKREVVSEN